MNASVDQLIAEAFGLARHWTEGRGCGDLLVLSRECW